jgi:hypothetical protein
MIPEQLELTPGMIRPLLANLTPEQIVWRPAPDRFSIAEVLAHLADALVALGEYSGRDAVESLEDFERQRKENLARVRGLKDRTLHHKKVGPISLSDLLNECAYHDLGHIRQIAELVRALKYYPNMGLYAKFYKVSP